MAPEWISGQSQEHPEWRSRIAHYDTDWSVTGPLIEQFGIASYPLRNYTVDSDETQGWVARWKHSVDASGPTPLIAVCNLILALKTAGKLAA